jgi:hypothetical protein
MGSGSSNGVLGVLLLCVALTLLLVIVGFVLRRRGSLATSRAALGWAVLCLVPLFGAGVAMWGTHEERLATGADRPGVNTLPPPEQGPGATHR